MNAEEAKKITMKNQKEYAAPILEIIHCAIKKAAENGRSEVMNPHVHDAVKADSHALEMAWAKLAFDGFTVKHMPDPDPGHPCSRPYTMVSW